MRALKALAVLVALAAPTSAWANEPASPETSVDAIQIPADLALDVTDIPGGKEQLVCLALNDYWEARGERLKGRVAVAKVVLNRVRDSRYPETVCDVVTENRTPGSRACQFSWNCDDRADTPEEAQSWRESLLLAAAILHAGWQIDDPSKGALWYHATSVHPEWAGTLNESAAIGQHVFYRDPGRSTPQFSYLGRPTITDPQVASID